MQILYNKQHGPPFTQSVHGLVLVQRPSLPKQVTYLVSKRILELSNEKIPSNSTAVLVFNKDRILEYDEEDLLDIGKGTDHVFSFTCTGFKNAIILVPSSLLYLQINFPSTLHVLLLDEDLNTLVQTQHVLSSFARLTKERVASGILNSTMTTYQYIPTYDVAKEWVENYELESNSQAVYACVEVVEMPTN